MESGVYGCFGVGVWNGNEALARMMMGADILARAEGRRLCIAG
jgi:hypothetical protein